MAKRTVEDIKFEDARLAHAAANKSIEIEAAMVATFASAAMRAPALAGAGGIAAMLGFFSANAGTLRGTAAVEDFNSALFWFFASILGCVLAPGAAYFSQECFVWAREAQAQAKEPPFIRDTRRSNLLTLAGVGFQVFAISFTVVSICTLIAGGREFMNVANFVTHASSALESGLCAERAGFLNHR
jgi:hypothetical protein